MSGNRNVTAPEPAAPRTAGRAGRRSRKLAARSNNPDVGRDSPSLPAGFLAVCGPLASDLVRRRELFIAEPSELNVHALRGAARRLQAAISLFEEVLHPRDAKWLRAELKALVRRLGRLRDLDVFLSRVSNSRRKHYAPDTRPEDLLLGEATQARRVEVASAVAAFRSARAALVVGGIEGWLFEAAAELEPKDSLSDHAVPALQRLHGRVREAGRNITRLRARRRHALRLLVKRLRCSAEAIAQLYGIGAADPYLAAVAALGHQLGEMNDDEVGAQLANALFDGAGASKSTRAHARSQREKLADTWKGFIAAPPFWEACGQPRP